MSDKVVVSQSPRVEEPTPMHLVGTTVRGPHILHTESQEEWLKARHQYLTATGVAKILGLDPYCSKKEYVRQKLAAEYVPLEDSRNLFMGREYEQANLSVFSKATGIETKSSNAMYVNTSFFYLSATIDGYINVRTITKQSLDNLHLIAWDNSSAVQHLTSLSRIEDSHCLVELKNSDSKFFYAEVEGKHNSYHDIYKKRSADEPPMVYWLQCQQQMLVTGYRHTLLLAKCGANGFTMFHIPQTQKGIDKVLEAQEIFRQEVVLRR